MPLDNHDTTADDQALERLFQRTQPARKEVDVLAIVAGHSSPTSQLVDEKYAWNSSSWSSKLSLLWSSNVGLRAVAVVVTVGVLALFFLPLTVDDQVAFAQIQERIEAVRTVEYVETSYAPGERDRAGEVKEQTLEAAIEKLKERLKSADSKLAKELEFELKFLSELPAQNANVLYVRRIRVKGKHLQRTDQLFPVTRSHVIRDAATGVTVAFYDDAKRKEVLTKQATIKRSGPGEETDIPKPPPTVDFFERFTSVPKDGLEQLPAQLINGENAVGLRSTEQRDGMTWTRTYWVRPASKLPVELWTELSSGTELKQRWVMNQFVYDAPLTDELFSTETPEGYSSGEGKIFGVSPK